MSLPKAYISERLMEVNENNASMVELSIGGAMHQARSIDGLLIVLGLIGQPEEAAIPHLQRYRYYYFPTNDVYYAVEKTKEVTSN